MTALHTVVPIKHFHLFCGLGGGAKGFNRGHARVGSLEARFECVGGVDVDAAAIRDFTRAAGVAGTVLDLFNREQYAAFHGKEPPKGWREAAPADMRAAAHGEFPDIIFLSAPCKGFSGLLPEASSKTAKYQALNGLTLRGVMLMVEAFKDQPPKLIVFENVPRIMVRGRPLLDQICAVLRAAGYETAETTHDCGVLGGLGQSRKRFLLVARHRASVPPFLYEPPKRRLRGVGEILEKLPMPGDLRAGPMHRMPALQWKTWVRLAFVEAGSDWRSLNKLNVADGVLTDFSIMPDIEWQGGVLGVRRWEDSSGVVTARGSPTTGTFAVADPRIDGHEKSVQMGVGRWKQPAAVVKGDVSVGTGRYAVADPRTGYGPNAHANILRIAPWEEHAGAVTGANHVTGAAPLVADPRFEGKPHFNNVFRIVPWQDNAGAVTAGHGPSSGGQAVADPRVEWNENAHASKLAVQDWDESARTIGGARFGSGGGAVADPRPPQREDYKSTKYRVTSMDESSGAVIGASTTGNGAFAVADPRPIDELRGGAYGVKPMAEPSGVVAGESLPSNGAFAVADPRPVGLNANRDAYKTGGHYGVKPWDASSGAVSAAGQADNGPWSVADPRDPPSIQFSLTDDHKSISLPKAEDRLVAVIRAIDDTWHRPFTTLELAALQSLVDPEEVFQLDGQSDSAWRERIGNAVPPDAAQAVASVMGTTLLLAMTGETFTLSNDKIWVQQLQVALAVDQSVNARWLD